MYAFQVNDTSITQIKTSVDTYKLDNYGTADCGEEWEGVMTNTKFLNIKIWDGATQKFVNESPKIELLNAEGETVDTITLNFNATSCTVSDGVTILTGEAAS